MRACVCVLVHVRAPLSPNSNSSRNSNRFSNSIFLSKWKKIFWTKMLKWNKSEKSVAKGKEMKPKAQRNNTMTIWMEWVFSQHRTEFWLFSYIELGLARPTHTHTLQEHSAYIHDHTPNRAFAWMWVSVCVSVCVRQRIHAQCSPCRYTTTSSSSSSSNDSGRTTNTTTIYYLLQPTPSSSSSPSAPPLQLSSHTHSLSQSRCLNCRRTINA